MQLVTFDFLDTVSKRDRHQIGTIEELQELAEEKTLDFIGATRRIRTDDLLITNRKQSPTPYHSMALGAQSSWDSSKF